MAKLTQEFEQLSGNKEFQVRERSRVVESGAGGARAKQVMCVCVCVEQGMMETLMKQLLSKETLYEPLSQILELVRHRCVLRRRASGPGCGDVANTCVVATPLVSRLAG